MIALLRVSTKSGAPNMDSTQENPQMRTPKSAPPQFTETPVLLRLEPPFSLLKGPSTKAVHTSAPE